MSQQLKRSRLVTALRTLPLEIKERLKLLKTDGNLLRKRPDLIWYLLLQSTATHGNSRGWNGLRGNQKNFESVAYAQLAYRNVADREKIILAALRTANVRMPTIKAPRLAANVSLIAKLGGVEQATQLMLSLSTRDEKYRFARSFSGIGEKYGRNIWMDIYDPAFRDTVAIDDRLKKIAVALGFTGKRYSDTEAFFCMIATDAELEPWELDRLLYNFKDHFLAAIDLTPPTLNVKRLILKQCCQKFK